MIRQANLSDGPAVVAMLKRFYIASKLQFNFSPTQTERHFRIYTQDPDRLCMILEVDGVMAGVMMAHVAEHPFSWERIAGELCWWIEPKYRRGKNAVHMIKYYEQWAKSRDCTLVSLVTLVGNPRPSTLYQRLGYKPEETLFSKSI